MKHKLALDYLKKQYRKYTEKSPNTGDIGNFVLHFDVDFKDMDKMIKEEDYMFYYHRGINPDDELY